METSKLKKFAQYARRSLIDQVSNKLVLVLAEGSAARRESATAVKKLEEQIREHGKEQVIEKIAYIWFNRFCALRFMDVNRYIRIGVVSPADGQFQPEILAEAKMGHIDENTVPEKIRQQIFALLGGTAPSRDPQPEAYRLLVVAACNDYHKAMPYLFERIADYTELLMPDDLLSGNSILAYTREAMTPDICRDVEVIGWLYQFYISEKKDAVFDGLKKNKKITPENIPAATQLFTPHWIVRYLVENSLGRLWMLNHPNSRLVEQMNYYIKPEQAETDFLRINKPEELKICDPACGSGHMLVYAFDLLYAIYEEEGVDPAEIPEKILTHNLYGIEIDERAGELAAFALTMKARAKQRRFFSKQVAPNICVLENIQFDETEINEYMDFVGQDIFTLGLKTTLHQFEEADNFGSLILPEVTNVESMLTVLSVKDFSTDWIYKDIHQKVLQALQQADYLSPKYHVVIANPPYLGIGGMNDRLKVFASEFYPSSKNDLYSMFIERNLDLVCEQGLVGMITMQSWMYLSRFERFRLSILNKSEIQSFIHLGRRAFDSISGEVVQTAAFILTRGINGHLSTFVDLTGVDGEQKKSLLFKEEKKYIKLSSSIFKTIPGWPITYKMSPEVFKLFERRQPLESAVFSSSANVTGDNNRFLKQIWEVSSNKVSLKPPYEWIPCAKGGGKRRWYGNLDFVIAWSENAHDYYRSTKVCRYVQEEHWFKKGLTWSRIASAENISFRLLPTVATFETAGMTLFPNKQSQLSIILGYLNSCVANQILKWLNPTLTLQMCDVLAVPFVESNINSECEGRVKGNVNRLIELSKTDWDAFESSLDFASLPLLNLHSCQPTLNATYEKLRLYWREMTLEMQGLEEENDSIFIDGYGLQDELKPKVPINEITLTCNPHYRYGNNKNEEELEALLLTDTMKEFISYAVGCMFGRYSLDKPGLILANQSETISDYMKQIPEPSFPADDDNVIPMLDGDWFTDDITERFCKFLKLTFGDEYYEENLMFIEKALGKDIRKYFLKDFYNDHVRRYKKRPIYWLFSSPKGSFNALIYMHRYRPDMVSVVLNDYLREFRTKLSARKNHLEAVSISANASQGEKTTALKEVENLRKIIDELDIYEREVLYPLATEQMEIDLDDGVKVNYQKFGEALKKIPGLAAKDED